MGEYGVGMDILMFAFTSRKNYSESLNRNNCGSGCPRRLDVRSTSIISSLPFAVHSRFQSRSAAVSNIISAVFWRRCGN